MILILVLCPAVILRLSNQDVPEPLQTSPPDSSAVAQFLEENFSGLEVGTLLIWTYKSLINMQYL